MKKESLQGYLVHYCVCACICFVCACVCVYNTKLLLFILWCILTLAVRSRCSLLISRCRVPSTGACNALSNYASNRVSRIDVCSFVCLFPDCPR